MSNSIRHQIFVSSTFSDLIIERSEVIQALWELDCIPTGMEAFVASNENQWDVIKRVIDECDYYVLIIGGRYGSTTETGISYTEKEFDYAQSIGLPVLAFVHSNPDEISVGKSEKSSDLKEKLVQFRKRVMDKYPIKPWSTAQELGGAVSRAVVREIKINPRPGWIRNDGDSRISLLEQINRLTSENEKLRSDISTTYLNESPDNLADGSDVLTIVGNIDGKSPSRPDKTIRWSSKATWDDIFKDIGPALINEASEEDLKIAIARFWGWSKDVPDDFVDTSNKIEPESWNQILIQFRALGYITHGSKRRSVNDKGRYWSITPRGDRYLLGLLAKKKTA